VESVGSPQSLSAMDARLLAAHGCLMSGAAVWLIHGILMLVAAANLLSLVGLGGSSSNLFLIASAFRAYGWALLALLVAGTLYGVGWALLGRWGLPVSKERMMGGVLFLGYGFHAGVTLALLPGVAYVFYAWVAGAYIAWLVGSILLLLAARAVAGSVRRPAGTGLKAYAMANLLGVILFLVAGLVLLFGLSSFSLDLLVGGLAIGMVAGLVSFFAVPIIGLVAFVLLLWSELRAWSASRPAPLSPDLAPPGTPPVS